MVGSMADERLIRAVGRSELELNSKGPGIRKLVLNGHLIIGSSADTLGNIYGFPCAPFFGQDHNFGLPFDGPVKDQETNIRRSNQIGEILTSTFIIQDGYPEGLEVTYRFVLGRLSVTIGTTMLNSSDFTVPINPGYRMQIDAPGGLTGASLNQDPIEKLIAEKASPRGGAFS
jgi:hypothetical protein